VLFRSAGSSAEEVATLYQISDAICMVSGAEGFGVPTIEATACGIPTVYTDYAGCGEIGRVCSGRPVPWTGWEPNPSSQVRWVHPDVDRAIEAFWKIAQEKETYRSPATKTRLHELAKKHFDYDLIAAKWLEILHDVNDAQPMRILGTRL